MPRLPGPEKVPTVAPRGSSIPRVPSIPQSPVELLGTAAVDAIAKINAAQVRRNQLEETLFIDRAEVEYATRLASDYDNLDKDPKFPKSSQEYLDERERLREIARGEFDKKTSPHGHPLSAERMALKYDKIEATAAANGRAVQRDFQEKEAADALEAIGNKHATTVRNTGNLAAAMLDLEEDFAQYKGKMNEDLYRDSWATSYKNVVRAAVMGHARRTNTEEAKSLVNDEVFGQFFSEAEKEALINAVDAIGEDVRIQTESLAYFETVMGENKPEDATVLLAMAHPDGKVGAATADKVKVQFAAERRADADTALLYSREAMVLAEQGLIDNLDPEKANFLGTDMIRIREYSQRRALGEPIKTNWAIFNIIRSGSIDPVAFAKMDMKANFRMSLGDTEFKEIVRFQETVRQSLANGTEGDIISAVTQTNSKAASLNLEGMELGQFQMEAWRRFAAYKTKHGSNPDDATRLAILNEMSANRTVAKTPPTDTGTVTQFIDNTVNVLAGSKSVSDKAEVRRALRTVTNLAARNKGEDLSPEDLDAIGRFFDSDLEINPPGAGLDISLLEAFEQGLIPDAVLDRGVEEAVPQHFIDDMKRLLGREATDSLILEAYVWHLTHDQRLPQLRAERGTPTPEASPEGFTGN